MKIMRAKKTLKQELADMAINDGFAIEAERENSYRASIFQLKRDNPEYKGWKFKISNDVETGQRGIFRTA